MNLHAYLPQDRLRALARGETLPDRTNGSALFADISGFTALTEALRESLGSRRGGEELTKHLDEVYTALIKQVEKYGGSVIDFAGDAITCWFDQTLIDPKGLQDSSRRNQPLPDPSGLAVTCAFALQQAMGAFEAIALPNGARVTLSLKVTVATGSARRFVVGDPTIHYLDALAGATVARTAAAEHLAQKGEVILDEATVNALGDALKIKEWRDDHETQERFAVVGGWETGDRGQAAHASRPQTSAALPLPDELKAWLPQPVYEREQAGQGSFLTEFRPCVALFVRFAGIDYDSDEAEKQLDAFIRGMQTIVARYEGTLLQITIGDKGSYAFINFGVLTTHEDDARRAVKTAFDLEKAAAELGFLAPLQMGLTQGVMRVGAYGGQTRKTFGALGDEVNLAARLMQSAASGEILLSGHMHQAAEQEFSFEPRPPLPMKGKAEPLPVFAVTSERQQRAIRLQEPTYALPMVGREKELALINEQLAMTLRGKGQVIGIIAEAGLGKSRLVAEVIRSARKKGFAGYGGACQSDAINTPYQAWKSIWSAFFDVDPSAPLRKQMRSLENEIEDRAPERVQALPLLGSLLNLEIPDNDFTKTLEPKYRQSALRALLEDCLRAEALHATPLLIVIEDLHWIDALSHDLLEELAKALTDCPICFVLAYRPPQLQRLQAPRLEALSNFTRIELSELTQAEAGQAIRAKLALLYPARSGAVPIGLVDKLMARSQGNPFYLEELLNYLHDRGLDPRDPHDLEKIELPDSLHTLILSRLDQLSDHEKTTLRVASIIGRLFRAAWLAGYYPELGDLPRVKIDLDQLAAMDITPLDTPESELAYLFKHIVTHEVTYESLPFATRARLHEQLAEYLETLVEHASSLLSTITFHYGRSENIEKQREYLRKAGDAAQATFANTAALDYYGRLLPLLTESGEQADLQLKRGAVLEVMGDWAAAQAAYRRALELAEQGTDLRARAEFALGFLCRQRGEYETALRWLEQAQADWLVLADQSGLGRTRVEMGVALWQKRDMTLAKEALTEGLALARLAQDKAIIARALDNFGIVARIQGDSVAARAFYEESLALRREIGDKRGITISLYHIGYMAKGQGDYATARALLEESLTLSREIGDMWGIAGSLIELGSYYRKQGNYTAARTRSEESLALSRTMGDKQDIADSLNSLGVLNSDQGDYVAARTLYGESLALFREIGNKLGIAKLLNNLGYLSQVQDDYPAARSFYEESLSLRHEIGDKHGSAETLENLGFVALAQSDTAAAIGWLKEGLALCRELGDKPNIMYDLIGFARAVISQDQGASRAAQLAGAAEAMRMALGESLSPFERGVYERTLATAKAALGEEAFNAAFEAGQKMTLDEAIELALKE